jgi:hypothetical protein
MELFVIPTHRICKEAVESILEEINYIKYEEVDFGLVVLDNSKKEIFLNNHDFLISVRNRHRNLHIYHIGLDSMLKIVKGISDKCLIPYDELKEMLYPDDINYGKIGNFLYLITVLLGAKGFHRRDSDCFIFEMEKESYPIIPEAKYLGNKVKEIENVMKQEELDYKEDERVYIVGGDYSGNWDLDTQKVNEANPRAMEYMMRICGIPEEDIHEQFEIKYNQEEDEGNKLPVLSSVFEVSQSPECGNISMYEVFRYIPNFIGQNGIGFDNHTYFITFLVKAPVIYHFNRILHMHDENRIKDINLSSYWRGIAKMVDFDCYHLEFIEAGFGDMMCKDGVGINAIKDSYQEFLPDSFEKIFDELQYEKRINRIETIAEKILRPTNIEDYIKVANYLQEEKHNIIHQLDEEYKLSIKLQRSWKDIIKALDAMTLHYSDFIQEI